MMYVIWVKIRKMRIKVTSGSAFEENFKIGDTVSVTVDGITKSFQVTGFVQSVNLQGELCELSIEGYKQISLTKTDSIPLCILKMLKMPKRLQRNINPITSALVWTQ